MEDFAIPDHPFIEVWEYRIRVSAEGDDQRFRSANQLHNDVLKHLVDSSEAPSAPSETEIGSLIYPELSELVGDRLESPDYETFIAEYYEREGSLEIGFLVVGAFYGGVCGYGAFRQGLDYIHQDLKKLFKGVSHTRTKVRKRFQRRRDLNTQ